MVGTRRRGVSGCGVTNNMDFLLKEEVRPGNGALARELWGAVPSPIQLRRNIVVQTDPVGGVAAIPRSEANGQRSRIAMSGTIHGIYVLSHLLLPMHRGWRLDERRFGRRERSQGTPLATELWHCTAYPEIPEATWAQPLSREEPVLTLGVFRRSRSVACIRADASPSEVHLTPV